MAFVLPRFDDFTPQPPTPPSDVDKGVVDDVLQFLNTSFADSNDVSPQPSQVLSLSGPAVDTPPPSSPSPAENVTRSLEPPLKKIRFSEYPEEIHSTPPSNTATGTQPPLPRPATAKSILKPSAPPPWSEDVENSAMSRIHQPPSLAAMLESVMKQLEGQTRSSRLDAYMILSGSYKTQDRIPEPQTFLDNLSFFESCLRRDSKAKLHSSGSSDTNLVQQALKLTKIFLRTPTIFSALSRDFMSDLIEDAIASLASTQLSKTVFLSYLLILVQTPLLKHTANSSRSHKILSSLKDLHTRHTGNKVLSFRISMYVMLFDKAEPVMVDRVDDWLPHILFGLLNVNKDVRLRAIEAIEKTGLILGSKVKPAKAIHAILNQDLDKLGSKFCDMLQSRMEKQLDEREDGHHIPRIWSAFILLVRMRYDPLKDWPYFAAWMRLMQRCFNSSDRRMCLQAYYAWDRLTFAIKPDRNTRLSFIKLMRQPIVSCLSRKSLDKDAELIKNAAFASYCTLLYYAFRPQGPAQQMDLYWEEFVLQVFNRNTVINEADANRACRVLNALFGNAQNMLWEESRGIANDRYPVVPQDLPRLPVWWIRRRLPVIYGLIELLLKKSAWHTTDQNFCDIETLWSNLMSSIAEAGSKEIKASVDLKQAIAESITLLFRVWSSGPSSLERDGDAPGTFSVRFTFLVWKFMEGVGSINLASSILQRQQDNVFEVASSTTNIDRQDVRLISPIAALLPLLSKLDHTSDPTLAGQSKKLFTLCFEALTSHPSATSLTKEPALALSIFEKSISNIPLTDADREALAYMATSTDALVTDEEFGHQMDLSTNLPLASSLPMSSCPLQDKTDHNTQLDDPASQEGDFEQARPAERDTLDMEENKANSDPDKENTSSKRDAFDDSNKENNGDQQSGGIQSFSDPLQKSNEIASKTTMVSQSILPGKTAVDSGNDQTVLLQDAIDIAPDHDMAMSNSDTTDSSDVFETPMSIADPEKDEAAVKTLRHALLDDSYDDLPIHEPSNHGTTDDELDKPEKSTSLRDLPKSLSRSSNSSANIASTPDFENVPDRIINDQSVENVTSSQDTSRIEDSFTEMGQRRETRLKAKQQDREGGELPNSSARVTRARKRGRAATAADDDLNISQDSSSASKRPKLRSDDRKDTTSTDPTDAVGKLRRTSRVLTQPDGRTKTSRHSRHDMSDSVTDQSPEAEDEEIFDCIMVARPPSPALDEVSEPGYVESPSQPQAASRSSLQAALTDCSPDLTPYKEESVSNRRRSSRIGKPLSNSRPEVLHDDSQKNTVQKAERAADSPDKSNIVGNDNNRVRSPSPSGAASENDTEISSTDGPSSRHKSFDEPSSIDTNQLEPILSPSSQPLEVLGELDSVEAAKHDQRMASTGDDVAEAQASTTQSIIERLRAVLSDCRQLGASGQQVDRSQLSQIRDLALEVQYAARDVAFSF